MCYFPEVKLRLSEEVTYSEADERWNQDSEPSLWTMRLCSWHCTCWWQLWELQAWPLEEIDIAAVPSNGKNGSIFHGFGKYG